LVVAKIASGLDDTFIAKNVGEAFRSARPNKPFRAENVAGETVIVKATPGEPESRRGRSPLRSEHRMPQHPARHDAPAHESPMRSSSLRLLGDNYICASH
jgi:hypothetical protein